MFRSTVVLTTICVLAALTLGTTYSVTKPLIANQEKKERRRALTQKALPGADEYKQRSFEGGEYYEGYRNGELIGYALFAEGDGYSGKIDMLVGIDREGIIKGVGILSQQETPGLGDKCAEIRPGEDRPWFLRQFKGKRRSELDLENIEAITGATITSEAIIKSVKKTVTEFLEKK